MELPQLRQRRAVARSARLGSEASKRVTELADRAQLGNTFVRADVGSGVGIGPRRTPTLVHLEEALEVVPQRFPIPRMKASSRARIGKRRSRRAPGPSPLRRSMGAMALKSHHAASRLCASFSSTIHLRVMVNTSIHRACSSRGTVLTMHAQSLL